METKTTNHAKTIVFCIVFSIISIILLAVTLFYFDLANGPLYLFILSLVLLVSCLVARIFLRKKKVLFRLIPLFALIVGNAFIIPFAKPSTEVFNAVDGKIEKTEVLELTDGKIVGSYNNDKSVQVYAGIPYAQAPIGELRWKEPVEIEAWNDIKDCTKFGPRCMQNDTAPIINSLVDIYSEKAWHPNYIMSPQQNMSEDCLYLNIWRPNNNQTNLPILVYIHGGSLTGGSSAFKEYNGEEMAKKNVIMITIQYRLGVFGYFAHPSLQEKSPNHTTGNYGLLDQIQALKWINKNAISFGGNPNNITIAGESAGSSSVSAICSSPLAKNLFKRAIGESSSLVVKNPPHTFRSLDKALQMGKDIVKEFNVSSIEELRKIPAEKLVTTKYTNSAMTLDGYALVKAPYEVYQEGNNNEEALLNGYNVLEGDAFVVPEYLFSPTTKDNILSRLQDKFGKEFGQKVYDLYLDKINQDAFSAMNEIFSTYWFMYPHYSWMNMAKNNGVNVYTYQFTKTNGYHSTYHAGEMIYCYGNVKHSSRSYAYNETDLALSETMLSYWANFAKNGNPNGENLPTWDLYNGELFELGERIGNKKDSNIEAFQLFDTYVPSLD